MEKQEKDYVATFVYIGLKTEPIRFIMEPEMKASEKKTLLKHINKDSKEFKQQLKEDQKLKQEIKRSSKGKK